MIRVCGDNMYPPFEYYDSEGDAVGFNIDLIRAIDRNTDTFNGGIEIELMPWQNIEEAIVNGKKDVIEGISITKQREKNLVFSNSMFEVSHNIYVLSGNREIYTYRDLKDKVILAQKNDPICGLRAEDTLIKDTFFKLKLVKDLEEGFETLARGVGDAIISPEPTAVYFQEKMGDRISVRPVTRLYWTDYAIGVKKENTELIEKINNGLEIISKIGELERLKTKWFGDRYNSKEAVKSEINTAGVWEVDSEGNVLKCFDRDNLFGDCENIFNLNDEGMTNSIRSVFLSSKPKTYIHNVRSDGFTREYCCEILPSFSGKNEIAVIVARNLTEEKRQNLYWLNRKKVRFIEEFVGRMFEVINVPFTTIKAFVDLLPENMDKEDFINEFQKYVPDAIEKISDLGKEMVPLAESNEREKIELLRSINLAVSEIENDENRRVKFITEIDEEMYVLFNKNSFHSVLIELFRNCIESSCNTVTISSEAFENKVKLSVRDDGCGINAEIMEHLFEPFYSTKAKHYGLGLSGIFMTVQRNMGELHVRPDVDSGTCIELILEGGM